MTRLVWDVTDPHAYEAGLDRGVFFPTGGVAEVWNGLVSVQESPSENDERVRYIDGARTRTRRRPGEFSGTIEAFTYPDSFYESVLEPRRPKPFHLSYRIRTAASYKIHLVYNVGLTPTKHDYIQTEPSTFSWDFTTLPVAIPNARPSAHLIIDPTMAYPSTIQDLEDVLYGAAFSIPRMPTPAEVFDIFEANSIVRIIDHGDGTWTATGPDNVISMLDATTFQIDWPSAVYVDNETYTIHSQ